MRMQARVAVLVVASFTVAGPTRAQSGRQAEAAVSPSAELRALYQEEQSDRTSGRFSAAEVAERDRQRLQRVEQLLQQGGLTSANDFFHAAMIYQHGTRPEDYVIANILATAAGFRGHRMGRWLAASTLDRLLITIGQTQFFGTQFQVNDRNLWEPGSPHPFLNPALRRVFELESRAELQAQADEANRPPE